MASTRFPGGEVAIAPHVHNARYACFIDPSDRNSFQFIAGYEECDRRYQVSRHSYPYLILEMIAKGSGQLSINDKKHAVGAGFCFCGGPEIDYELRSSSANPITKYFVAFGRTPTSNVAPHKRLYPGFTRSFSNPQDLIKWNELLIAEGAATPGSDTLENITALVGILVRKIAPDVQGANRRHSTDALVTKALSIIEKDFKALATLQELADTLAVSSEHLCRVFKLNGKASPYRILTRRKMEYAYAQLKMTRTPIQEIALSLGFTDSFHFSRAFKRRYGTAPSLVR